MAGNQQAAAFALHPSSLNPDTVLDYSEEAARKLYYKAVAGLDNQYNLQAGDLQVFLSRVRIHAQMYNLESVLKITINGVVKNVIDHYGEISMDTIKTDAAAYISNNSRKTQNSMMLYEFLVASLTETAAAELFASPEEYMVQDANNAKHPAGATFLKAIIQKAYVDTKATVMSIRHALARLDHKMEELNSDVKEFNEYVKGLRNMLRARGESTDEIMSHIFVGYAAASDQAFVAYMAQKRNQYEDGDENMDLNDLMQRALNKYNILVQSGRWNAPDKKDAAIFALKAEVESLKKSTKIVKASTPSGESRKSRRDKKWAWKKVKPGPNDPKEKEFQKRKYYWCPTHEAWTAHKPEDCKGKDFYKSGQSNDSNKETLEKGSREGKLKVAMQSLIRDDEDDEVSEDEE